MHNDYKKQMDDVHMPDHLKEAIYQSAQEKAGIPNKKHYFRSWKLCISSACVFMLMIGTYSLINDQYARGKKGINMKADKQTMMNKDNQESVDDSILYQPISFDQMMNHTCDEMSESSDSCAKTGTGEMVYSGQNLFGASSVLDDVSTTYPVYKIYEDAIQISMSTIADMLDVVYEEGSNLLETQQYIITCDRYGTLIVNDKQKYHYETISNTETFHEIVSKYSEIYKIAEPKLTATENGYIIQDNQHNMKENLIFSTSLTIIQDVETNTYQISVYGRMRDAIMVRYQLPIMEESLATTLLKNGKYYYKGTLFDQITTKDIQKVELMYGNAMQIETTYPYIIPMYQFYVNRDNQETICNVVALNQASLNMIDETIWMFQEK